MTATPSPTHARRREPPAARRHDDLHRDVGAGAASTARSTSARAFPDFDCDPQLLDAVDAAMRAGLNQYPPMAGVPALREARRRQDRGALRPPLRPGAARSRSRPARRRRSSPRSSPSCTRATRSSCSSPATTATSPTSSSPAARAVHVPLTPGTFRPDFDAHRRRARRRAPARSSSTRRTTRAPPSGRADDMRAPGRAAARRPTCS